MMAVTGLIGLILMGCLLLFGGVVAAILFFGNKDSREN